MSPPRLVAESELDDGLDVEDVDEACEDVVVVADGVVLFNTGQFELSLLSGGSMSKLTVGR